MNRLDAQTLACLARIAPQFDAPIPPFSRSFFSPQSAHPAPLKYSMQRIQNDV